MSITNEAMARFWRTMGERYGSRWLDTYTDKPTKAWRDCLSPFSPKVIGLAIELLAKRSEDKIAHPPTEPEFRSLLQMASRSAARPTEDPNELRRGYWRSSIVHTVSRGLGYIDANEFEPILVAHKDTLGSSMRYLLDECDDLELRTGQRTSGQDEHCRDRCADIVESFGHLRRGSAPALPPPVQPQLGADDWA